MRIETRTKYGRRLVRVLAASVKQRAMRQYLMRHGRPVKGRPGWLALSWKEWRNRPGVAAVPSGHGTPAVPGRPALSA